MRRLVTTLYFPAFAAANAADPVLSVLPGALRPLLVVQPDGDDQGTPVFRFDILLRGEPHEETPFFLD
jgi:protocatechuate 3,4-dioxygenase alpha subunit